MPEIIKECRCIDPDDKIELSKAILTRIGIYQDGIAETETEEIIEKTKTLKNGEIEIRPTKELVQYKAIINKLEDLHKRLQNTPECK